MTIEWSRSVVLVTLNMKQEKINNHILSVARLLCVYFILFQLLYHICVNVYVCSQLRNQLTQNMQLSIFIMYERQKKQQILFYKKRKKKKKK